MSDLAVRIRASDKGLEADLAGIKARFTSFAKDVASIAVPIAVVAGIAKAIDGLARIGETAIRAIAPLHDTAKQLGVTAERLQELRVVANAAGVDVGEFDQSLNVLNRNLGSAALGNGELAKSFEAVGLSLRDQDGRIKSTQQVWDELTKKFQDGSLSQEKAYGLAAAAFGRSGTKMVEVLRQTAEEQQRVIDTAREFGAIISNDVVAAADEYEDKLNLIQQGTAALGKQTDLILAPLTLKWASLKNEIAGATAELARAAGLIDDNATLQQRRLKALEEQIKLARSVHAVNAPNQPEAEDPYLAFLVKQYSDLRKAIYETQKAAESAAATMSGGGGLLGSDEDPDEAKKAAKYELDLVTAVYAERDRIAAEEAEAEKGYAQQIYEERERLAQLEIDQNKEWSDTLAAERERFNQQELDAERDLVNAVLLEHQRVADQETALAKRRKDDIVNGLIEATAIASSSSKKMFDLNKKLSIAQAVMSTHAAVTAALADVTVPTFARFALAAVAAAKGAASVSAIRATTFGGGTTPSAAGTPTVNGNPVPASQVITVRGVNPNDLFTGRQLADLLNGAIKDGARIVLQ